MTEDDTFRMLRRIPYDEMAEIVGKWITNLKDERLIGEILKIGNWEYHEFLEEEYRYEQRNK